MSYYPLNHATRKETDLELQAMEGSLLDDIHGYVFVNSPAGTVNHQTPAPKNGQMAANIIKMAFIAPVLAWPGRIKI